MKGTRRYLWSGHASSEGGPVIVADVDGYVAWRGAHEDWSDDATYRVHYYGPLIAKLAAQFQPSGSEEWHQYKVVTTSAAAHAFIKELRAEAEGLAPNLTIREQKQMEIAELLAKARAEGGGGGSIKDWLAAWRDH